MNLKEIKEMITLMNENNLTELELEREGLKIRLKRSTTDTDVLSNIIIEKAQLTEQQAKYIPVDSSKQQAPIPPKEESKNIVEIKAPMVGTFYRAPSPDSAPFAEVGTMVEIGQVVCIIEAMKLMNEIKSEVKGKVKEISVENADPIEFGQVLFKIETV